LDVGPVVRECCSGLFFIFWVANPFFDPIKEADRTKMHEHALAAARRFEMENTDYNGWLSILMFLTPLAPPPQGGYSLINTFKLKKSLYYFPEIYFKYHVMKNL